MSAFKRRRKTKVEQNAGRWEMVEAMFAQKKLRNLCVLLTECGRHSIYRAVANFMQIMPPAFRL